MVGSQALFPGGRAFSPFAFSGFDAPATDQAAIPFCKQLRLRAETADFSLK
jgi:hypothetical protein